jgi:hypothetical protein
MHPWALAISVIGLLIGTAGTMITTLTLRSEPTITLGPPINPVNILSTQVEISNDGALSLADVDIAIYIRRIQGPKYAVTAMAGNRYQPPSRRMQVGEKKTIRLGPTVNVGLPIRSVDMSLIVCYRPDVIPGWIWRGGPKVVLLDSVLQADGATRLRQQPDDGKILAEFEQFTGTKACTN